MTISADSFFKFSIKLYTISVVFPSPKWNYYIKKILPTPVLFIQGRHQIRLLAAPGGGHHVGTVNERLHALAVKIAVLVNRGHGHTLEQGLQPRCDQVLHETGFASACEATLFDDLPSLI